MSIINLIYFDRNYILVNVDLKPFLLYRNDAKVKRFNAKVKRNDAKVKRFNATLNGMYI